MTGVVPAGLRKGRSLCSPPGVVRGSSEGWMSCWSCSVCWGAAGEGVLQHWGGWFGLGALGVLPGLGFPQSWHHQALWGAGTAPGCSWSGQCWCIWCLWEQSPAWGAGVALWFVHWLWGALSVLSWEDLISGDSLDRVIEHKMRSIIFLLSWFSSSKATQESMKPAGVLTEGVGLRAAWMLIPSL